MSGISISIEDSLAHVGYEKNHVKYSKTVSVDTLVSSMASQYGIRVPGLLPAGCRYYMKKGEKHILFIEIPPIPRKIRYNNRSSKTIFDGIVPTPWTLLQITAVENQDGGFRVSGGSIYGLKRPLLSGDDRIYHYPAANVHSNHNICWGSTFSHGMIFKTLAELGRVVDYYFSSEFNNDISPRMNGYDRYEDLLRAIKDQKVFPPEVLVDANQTFDSLISGM